MSFAKLVKLFLRAVARDSKTRALGKQATSCTDKAIDGSCQS